MVHADCELISRFGDIEVLDEENMTVDECTGLVVIPSLSDGQNNLDNKKVIIHRGMTLSAVGFYGPQGRQLRLPLSNPELNSRIENFSYNGKRVTNYEMESSALAGLALLLGHKAVTICTIVANRYIKSALPNYKDSFANIVIAVLDRI